MLSGLQMHAARFHDVNTTNERASVSTQRFLSRLSQSAHKKLQSLDTSVRGPEDDQKSVKTVKITLI